MAGAPRQPVGGLTAQLSEGASTSARGGYGCRWVRLSAKSEAVLMRNVLLCGEILFYVLAMSRPQRPNGGIPPFSLRSKPLPLTPTPPGLSDSGVPSVEPVCARIRPCTSVPRAYYQRAASSHPPPCHHEQATDANAKTHGT